MHQARRAPRVPVGSFAVDDRDGAPRARPYRIAYASSDEGGLDSSAALQTRDADSGWMSSSGAEQSELILDLGQTVNITRISIRAHPICAPRKVQVFGSKSSDYEEARYRFLGEMLFNHDPYGDHKYLFLDTRQRFVMLIISKALEHKENAKEHVAIEFVEICGRPRADMEDRGGSAEGNYQPPMMGGGGGGRASSSLTTTLIERESSARSTRGGQSGYCGRCGRQSGTGDAYCRSCGTRL